MYRGNTVCVRTQTFAVHTITITQRQRARQAQYPIHVYAIPLLYVMTPCIQKD
jgi:hypothetical protein